MSCCFRVNGKVHGKWSVNDTACYFPCLIHLCKLVCLNRSRHFRIYDLNGCKRSNLRIGNTTCMNNLNRIVYYTYLVLKRRVRNKCNVRKEKHFIISLNLKKSHMGKRLTCPKTNLLIKHALKKSFCVDKSFHVHVSLTVMHKLNSRERCLCCILDVNNLKAAYVDIHACSYFLYLVLVSNQNSICNFSLLSCCNCLKHCIILCNRNCKLLHAA